MRKITSSLLMMALGAISLVGVSCETPGQGAANGALIGGGTGALVGGIIGHQTGNTTAGALIGGGVGAAAGGVAGYQQGQINQNNRRMDYIEARQNQQDAYNQGYNDARNQ